MMNKKDLIKRFELVSDNSYYILASNDHPLELYLGRNENGDLTLRFNGDFIPIKVKSSEILQVKQIRLKEHNSILFSYSNNEDPSIFYSFCEDVINSTVNCKKENGYAELVNRYNQWRKLFYSSRNLLSESEIMGLIGELLFLKNFLFDKYGQNAGINSWTGPEPTHKDFSFNDTWYEIKAINSFRKAVSISSIEQLDSEFEGQLVIYQLQKMSPNFNGVSLNKVVQDIINCLKIDEDRDIFVGKLKQAGYSYNEYYDDFIYEVSAVNRYRVDNSFPRIKREAVPEGIGGIKYELMLVYIEKYREP